MKFRKVQLRSDQGPNVNNLAWIIALGPGLSDHDDALIDRLERTLATTDRSQRHMVLNTLGAILYRAGRHGEAVERLTRGIEERGGEDVTQDWAFLALASLKLGRPTGADRWAEKLELWQPRPSQPWDNIEIETLREEVRSALRHGR